MAINTGRVVAGGLAGGVVANAIDFVSNKFILGEKMTAEMNAVSPSIGAAMATTEAMICFVVMDFLFALAIVWTYAAMRPRFGPGPGTAVKAGLVLWFVSGLAWYSWVTSGAMTTTTFATAAGVGLVNTLLTAVVGAMVYKED